MMRTPLTTSGPALATLAALAALATPALAAPAKKQGKAPPPVAALPVAGEALPVAGHATWPKQDYLYDVPSDRDAAGKVIVHWFCAPKAAACLEDLARIVTLKENGRVYVVAHISGNKPQAQKLDPIRESEGVGKGTVAFGRGATTLAKQLGFTGPASIVVGVDGKVALVVSGAGPADLDARDKQVTDLVAAIKEYVATPGAAPQGAKAGEPFTLSLQVQLASWLTLSTRTPLEFKLTAPPDFACDARELRGDKLAVDPATRTVTAKVTCRAPRGNYEARGELRFGYETPAKDAGLGTESAKWKFTVAP